MQDIIEGGALQGLDQRELGIVGVLSLCTLINAGALSLSTLITYKRTGMNHLLEIVGLVSIGFVPDKRDGGHRLEPGYLIPDLFDPVRGNGQMDLFGYR